MKAIRLIRLELSRLFRNPLALLVFALTALSPGAGLLLYRILNPELWPTMNDLYIAYPAQVGGMAGAALFALLTIWQLDVPHKFQVTGITDAIVSPPTQSLVRLLALLAASAAVQAAAVLLWLPWTMHRVGGVFDLSVYLLSYGILMFPSIVLAVLFSASAYQFTRRADLALTAFAAFAALSLTVWNQEWQLCWLNPILYALSDDFSNVRLFRTIGYARLTWLLALSGLWAVSYLCVRQYGKGLAGSFVQGVRRVYRPLIASILLLSAALAYTGQPFYDNSSPDLSGHVLDAENDPGLFCPELYANVVPDPKTGSVSGRAVYQMQNTAGQERLVELAVDPGYTLYSVLVNGQETECTFTDIRMTGGQVVTVPLPAAAESELEIVYSGFPREWNLCTYNPGEPEISGAYMCMENWLVFPTIRNAAPGEDGLDATLDITLPAQMLPIRFGPEEETLLCVNADGSNTWRIRFDRFRTIFYAGDYVRKDIQAAGLTISFYYGRKHETILEQAHVEEAVRRVVEYCTTHYGPLDWYADGKLKLLMTRISGGGYAGNGASTMDESDFTAENLLNADKGGGAGGGAVMIHELVHQWWGLGNMFSGLDIDTGWSSEGLTVYTTYRILKEMYGEEYAESHCVDAWRQAVDNCYRNFYIRNPEYLSALPEAYRYSIAGSISTVRQYNEMPLKILKAEQLSGGEEAMDQILRSLFNREPGPSWPYLTYQDFLDHCGLTEEDLSLD